MIIDSERLTLEELRAKRSEEMEIESRKETKKNIAVGAVGLGVVISVGAMAHAAFPVAFTPAYAALAGVTWGALPALVAMEFAGGVIDISLSVRKVISDAFKNRQLENQQPGSSNKSMPSFMGFNKIINSFKRGNSSVSFEVVDGDIRESYKDVGMAAQRFAELEKDDKPVMFIEVTNDSHSFNKLVIAKAGEDDFQPRESRPQLMEAIESARNECRQNFRI